MSGRDNIADSPESAKKDKKGITARLERRDGLGIEDVCSVDLTATAHYQLRIMDVPKQS